MQRLSDKLHLEPYTLCYDIGEEVEVEILTPLDMMHMWRMWMVIRDEMLIGATGE